MTGEWTAVGDLTTGAMLGHAAEPHADAHGGGAGGICLNCGTRRQGEFCHACGQSSHVHRDFGAIGHDLAHGVFHFEGRIWRTLPMLFLRPGELTRRYARGERARFVSPMALFLFIIFVLFAMLSVVGAHLEMPEFAGSKGAQGRVVIERSIAENAADTVTLTQRRVGATDPALIARLDARIAERAKETTALKTALDAIDGGNLSELEKIHTGWKRLDKGLAKAAENPNLALYKIQSNAYKFAWALIPFSLPFLWLLFPFSRRFTLYDHAVFVTYSLCFVSLAGMIASLVAMTGALSAGVLWAIVGIVVPIHLYKQLRGAYACGRFGAAVRTVLLFFGANLAVTAFLMLLLGLGLVG